MRWWALLTILWAAAGAYFIHFTTEARPAHQAATTTSYVRLQQDNWMPTLQILGKNSSEPLGCTNNSSLMSAPCPQSVNGAANSRPYMSLSSYELEPTEVLPPDMALKQAKCVENANLKWEEKPEAPYSVFMSTVQPFRNPYGLGAMCDWIVGVRWHFDVAFGNLSEAPRLIFVYVPMLDTFIMKILPCLSKPVVVIIADDDCTAPRQVDVRCPRNWNDAMWDSLVTDARVAHIWVSHLDVPPSAKVSPIPVGLNPGEFVGGDTNSLWTEQNMPPSNILERPLRMLVCDRVREDGSKQWDMRAAVRARCLSGWSAVCDARDGVQPFVDEIKKYPFIICTHGGGIDPNPKAWTALVAGVIPIMEHFPGDVIYHDLPVVIVDNLNSTDITADKLATWRNSLAHYFDDPASWARVVDKLQTHYWFRLVVASLYTGRGYGWVKSLHESILHSSTG